MREDSYRVLLEGGEGEYVEKKSRFIATFRTCGSEAEAMGFLEEMRKKYWDARHNCYAFVIGAKGELTRCSDDGEPSGTAGRPMLEVLTGEGIRNAAVVVTRYFGGVVEADYGDVGKLLYLLENAGIEPLSSDYGARAVLRLNIPAEGLESLRRDMADATSGRVKLDDLKEIYYIDKETG